MTPEQQKPKGETVRCLGGCDKTFLSRDRFTNRICPVCTRKMQTQTPPRVARVGTHHNGKPVNIPSEE